MTREDVYTMTGFVYGLIIGFSLGSIVWAMVRYVYLCIKDWMRKRKERRFTLGRDIKHQSVPQLISLDND